MQSSRTLFENGEMAVTLPTAGCETINEWVGEKNRASKEEETSDNIQEDETYLSICQMTIHVTCVAVSLDPLEPKKAHEIISEKLAAAFVWIQKLTTALSK